MVTLRATIKKEEERGGRRKNEEEKNLLALTTVANLQPSVAEDDVRRPNYKTHRFRCTLGGLCFYLV